MAARTRFFWHQTPEGHRHTAEPIIELIHSLGRKQLLPLILEQRQLLRLVFQIGETDSQKPDRLFQFNGSKNRQCRLVDLVTLIDIVLQRRLLSPTGEKIRIPDIQVDRLP